jgi:hypothetical protein
VRCPEKMKTEFNNKLILHGDGTYRIAVPINTVLVHKLKKNKIYKITIETVQNE